MKAMRSTIVTKISDVPPEAWTSVYPRVVEDYRFFRAIDDAGFDGVSFFYIMVYDGDVPAGAAPCFLMNYPFSTTVEGPLKALLLKVERGPLGRLVRPSALICGSIACEGRIGISGDNPGAVVDAVVDAMEGIAQSRGASILAFKDFSGRYTAPLARLPGRGFTRIMSYPSVALDIDFGSFEEYLARLSHATRKDLRRKFRKLATMPPVKLEVRQEIDAILDQIYALYLQTYTRSGVQFELLPKRFFSSIARAMGNSTTYFLWRVEGRLVAFNLCITADRTLVDEYIGFDYTVAHEHHLYFVTFRDIVEWCVKNGIKRYESGALTYEPKRRLGCSFIPNYIYAKHRNSFVNPLFAVICTLLKPERFDPELRDLIARRLL